VFAAERQHMLGVARVATYPKQVVFETGASQIVFELLLHVIRQRPALVGAPATACSILAIIEKTHGPLCLLRYSGECKNEELGLAVNQEKSRVAPIKETTFLGFQLLRGKIRVSNKARIRFKDRVRELTRRNNPLSMYQVVHELNIYVRGWVGYFGIQEFKYLFRDLDDWIRSRLRSMQLKKWKNPRKFQWIMIKAGFGSEEAGRIWIKMNQWQSVMRRPVRFAMNREWFRERGLVFLHDFTLAFSRP